MDRSQGYHCTRGLLRFGRVQVYLLGSGEHFQQRTKHLTSLVLIFIYLVVVNRSVDARVRCGRTCDCKGAAGGSDGAVMTEMSLLSFYF